MRDGESDNTITEVGDRIVVLFAYDKPVVVRKKGDCYQRIRTCFVDGVMKGEAVADDVGDGVFGVGVKVYIRPSVINEPC